MELCVGSDGICFCDPTCYAFGDCCDDIDSTCPVGKLVSIKSPSWLEGNQKVATAFLLL